jgi:hypothetical protein
MIQENDNQATQQENDTTEPSTESKGQQQQSDPQLTELKGFFDPKEDLEPTLEDGTKGPEKLKEENVDNTIEKNNKD